MNVNKKIFAEKAYFGNIFLFDLTALKVINRCGIVRFALRSICVCRERVSPPGRDSHSSPHSAAQRNFFPIEVGRKFMQKTNFYNTSCESSLLNMYNASILTLSQNRICLLFKAKWKCFKISYRRKKYVIVPLLHNENELF